MSTAAEEWHNEDGASAVAVEEEATIKETSRSLLNELLEQTEIDQKTLIACYGLGPASLAATLRGLASSRRLVDPRARQALFYQISHSRKRFSTVQLLELVDSLSLIKSDRRQVQATDEPNFYKTVASLVGQIILKRNQLSPGEISSLIVSLRTIRFRISKKLTDPQLLVAREQEKSSSKNAKKPAKKGGKKK